MKLTSSIEHRLYTSASEPAAIGLSLLSQREVLAAIILLVLAVAADRFSVSAAGTNFRTELIAGGLLAAWLLFRSRGTALRGVGLIELCLLGWLAANIVSSALFSPSPKESLKYALIIAGLITIYGAAIMLLRSQQAIKWAAIAWVAVGAGVAFFGLISALLYTFFGSTAGINLERFYHDGIFIITPKVQSVIWEPNIFGSYSLTVASLAFALSLSPAFQSSSHQRWLRFAVVCACCGVMLSVTRTVWIIAPLLLLLLAALSLWLKLTSVRQILVGLVTPAALGVVIGLVVGSFMMPTLSWKITDPWDLTYEQVTRSVPYLLKGQEPPAQITGKQPVTPVVPNASGPSAPVTKGSTIGDKVQDTVSPATAPSLQIRNGVYAQALQDWRRRPLLGWGAGSFSILHPPEPGGAFWVANLELHVLFDTGIVGLAFLAVAFGVAGRRAVRVLRSPRSSWEPCTTYFILFGLALGGLGLLAAYQVTEGTWLGFTWVFFAMLVAAARYAPPVKDVPAP